MADLNHQTANRTSFLAMIAGLLFSVWVFAMNFNGPVAGEHAFRQSQTAFSVHRYLETGIKIDYETPLFGPPWQVPFEFPTFQMMAAFLAKTASIDATPACRWVSIAFFYVFCLASALAMKELSLPTPLRRLSLAILFFSPLYLNWSRATLIETTTIAFGMISYWLTLRAIRKRSLPDALGAAVALIILMMTKITTAPVFMILMLFPLWAEFRRKSHRIPLILGAAMAVGVVLQAFWNNHCDAIKLQNPMTIPLTTFALKKWTFGEPMARFDLNDWKDHLRRVSWLALGQPLVLFVCLVASFKVSPKSRKQVWLLLALACLPVFVFYNLQRAHSYYSMANAFLVLFICALVVYEWCVRVEEKLMNPFGKAALVFAMIAVIPFYEVRGFMRTYYDPIMIKKPLEWKLPETLQATTHPDETLLVIGSDWDPTVPYELRHPAVVWSQSLKISWETYFEFVRQHKAELKIGGIVLCGSLSTEKLEQLFTLLPELNRKAVQGSNCDLYPKLALNH